MTDVPIATNEVVETRISEEGMNVRRFVGAFAILTASLSSHAGGFSGRVVDIVTRTGIPAVSVIVKSAGGGKVLGKAQTDANGAYTITNLPNGGRVQLYCVRDGFQARPTIVLVTLTDETRNPGAVRMVSEQLNASYLQSFAQQFATADQETQKAMRALWFRLPQENSAIIGEQYAALTGNVASGQYEMYVAEADSEQAMLTALAALETSDTSEYAEATTRFVKH